MNETPSREPVSGKLNTRKYERHPYPVVRVHFKNNSYTLSFNSIASRTFKLDKCKALNLEFDKRRQMIIAKPNKDKEKYGEEHRYNLTRYSCNGKACNTSCSISPFVHHHALWIGNDEWFTIDIIDDKLYFGPIPKRIRPIVSIPQQQKPQNQKKTA